MTAHIDRKFFDIISSAFPLMTSSSGKKRVPCDEDLAIAGHSPYEPAPSRSYGLIPATSHLGQVSNQPWMGFW